MASGLQRRTNAAGQSSRDSGAVETVTSQDSGQSVEKRRDMEKFVGQSSAGVLLDGILPVLGTWGLTMGLIFGGCCSNVFALESIIKQESDSGLLITLAQFATIFLFTLPGHTDFSGSSRVLKKRAVPLVRWLPAIAMFFTVNIINNFVFGFAISVPVHIILRSGGSVMTMLVGYAWGKRYNRGQVLGVAMLTIGVIVAAMADAQSKGKMSHSSSGSTSSFLTGLFLLFIAQLISAVMGLYIQLTYTKYGPHWHENLFYSHFLSLPLFMPILPSLWSQFQKLMDSPPLTLNLPTSPWLYGGLTGWSVPSDKAWISKRTLFSLHLGIPSQVVNLAVNALTQFVCIRGVNLLGTKTSALGVTIVLNLRKLVSLFLSIWLFGNKLPTGVAVGAAIVFTGAAIYGWSGQSRAKEKQQDPEKRKTG